MHRTPQPPRPRFLWRRYLLAFATASLLTGCANGDFGEVNPTLVRDDMHDWIGPAAVGGHSLPSHYSLTDDERALRDLAYPLIEPPYDRQQWYSVAGEYGLFGAGNRVPFDRTAYSRRLRDGDYRSASARYAQISDDIRNDTTRLAQFFETAARVRDVDEKRRKSMALVANLTPNERANAVRRMRENAAIIALVEINLQQRVAGYRYALERLVIATPATQAADVEHSLNRLRDRIAYYRTHRTPPWVHEQNLASMH